MKNIHILPTDKPSRLSIIDSQLIYSKEYFINPQNIYITSDEEIKEDSYILWEGKVYTYREFMTMKTPVYTDFYPIVLTTDQDLIKDGVQAIHDTFLEWFVKNPSCEWVEVGYGWIRLDETDNEGYWVSIPDKQFEMQQEELKLINNCPKCGLDLVEREGSKPVCTRIDCGGIILSNETLREWTLKEEPKQECTHQPRAREYYRAGCYKCFDCHKIIVEHNNIEQQETIEETAENYSQKYSQKVGRKYGFMDGAEYQAKGMYSEEEVRKLLETQRGNCYVAILTKTKDKELAAIAGGAPEPSGYNGWVKQFKKK